MIAIRISMLINVEKEKLVIDLYYNQRKNVRQIAQEARISFRDIAAILKKKEAEVNHASGNGNGIVVIDNRQQQQQSNDSNNNNKSPNEKAQAYKLFSEGKKPVDVAIQLGLSEKQATRYYREYLELEGLYELTLLYEERKHHLPSFLKLHKIMERQGMGEDDIANVLKYSNELPNLQYVQAKILPYLLY